MGKLIDFRPRGGLERKTRAPSRSEVAQIMFFTGVRYQRMGDAAAPASESEFGAPPSGGVGGAGGGRRKRRG